MDQLSLFAAANEPALESQGPALPDRDARRRIGTDLRTSLLVEAGAGAGKTTAMVGRMVALVRTGTAEVGQIAAVTFTRKAAAELRERFQTALERELRVSLDAGEAETSSRIDAALREIDSAFLGTIHSFCARLLRERPLDAGLDPAFRETLGAEESRLRRRFWHAHVERLTAAGAPALAALRAAGLRPQSLTRLFDELVGQPDVEYAAQEEDRPDAASIRRRIEHVMDRAASHLPTEEPEGGWDALQTSLRMLRFHRWVTGWTDDARLFDVLSELRPSSFRPTKRKWTDGDAAKEIQAELAELFAEGGAVNAALRQWWAWRYPIALRFVREAAAAYQLERVRAGRLNFQDLLMLTARMLRESAPARRELSDRFRFLLVDEFQDTDPMQAEVLFLLASDEELDMFDDTPGAITPRNRRPPFASWRHLVPRPGALFVVGDPKQSIYRFRRADMMLYQQVKRRFEDFGAVLELTSNFRSMKPIEVFVNDVFGRRFPDESTPLQARFAPMSVQTSESAAAGVFWYELDDPVHGRVAQLAKQDSERLATYIAERVARGERRPGDFLVLTPTTKWLSRYAAALEARNIPVQVTGAGVGGNGNVELEELRLLLRALSDPGDPTLTLAALVGVLFGLDYEQLLQHAEKWTRADEARAPFSFTRDWDDAETAVERALQTLHGFWRSSRELPADVAIPQIVAALGLVPFAAAGELGESRAGALLFVLEAVRAAVVRGDASLSGALAALDVALDEDESEAPLEPGRADVVRVMNLHKAKGLEATVVVLAMPFGDWSPVPSARVVRDEAGRALGYATVTVRKARNQDVTLARPADWDEHAAIEQQFRRAEDDRLLYVAATRAAEELVVGCAYNANSPSKWRSFHEWLAHHGTRITLPQPERAAREELAETADEMRQAMARVDAARAAHRQPTFRAAAVTERKLEVRREARTGVPSPAAPEMAMAGRGTEWGTAVHLALEAAARGLEGDRLEMACRSILSSLDRPLDDSGAPSELAELLAQIAGVRGSLVWQRALRAEQRLLEVPFAVRFEGAEYARRTGADAAAPTELIEGRIDLVFREPAGWVIVDYKSDTAGAAIASALRQQYEAQLQLYAMAWEQATGEPVTERMLLFTATGEQLVPAEQDLPPRVG